MSARVRPLQTIGVYIDIYVCIYIYIYNIYIYIYIHMYYYCYIFIILVVIVIAFPREELARLRIPKAERFGGFPSSGGICRSSDNESRSGRTPRLPDSCLCANLGVSGFVCAPCPSLRDPDGSPSHERCFRSRAGLLYLFTPALRVTQGASPAKLRKAVHPLQVLITHIISTRSFAEFRHGGSVRARGAAI